MKQPLLGKKISDLRKQKGLTQEDLVEKCNINVRTIQRIESGETTPRVYTIKTILNALGLDYEKVFEGKYEEGKFDKILRFFPSNLRQVLNVSLIAGIVYFILGFAETAFYATSLSSVSSETNWSDLPMNNYKSYSSNTVYIIIKIISVISFGFFMRGFVLVGSYYKNYLVELMAFLMIIMNTIFVNCGYEKTNTIMNFKNFIYNKKTKESNLLGVLFVVVVTILCATVLYYGFWIT